MILWRPVRWHKIEPAPGRRRPVNVISSTYSVFDSAFGWVFVFEVARLGLLLLLATRSEGRTLAKGGLKDRRFVEIFSRRSNG
jgi:hypothetical protein